MAEPRPWGHPEFRAGPPPGAEPWGIPAPGDFGPSSAGVNVNTESTLSIPSAMACVRILSTTISSLPWYAYTTVGGLQVKTPKQPKLLSDPFVDVPLEVGLTQIVASMALRGNAYAVTLARDAMLYPTALQLVAPDVVRLGKRPNGSNGWTINRIAIDDEDMVHVAHLALPGSVLGVSVIEYCAGTIGLTVAAEEFGAKWFKAGMHGTGVLTTPDRLDNFQARELAERLASRHVGASNWQNPFVLTGGMAWQPLSVTPEESQFLQTRGFQRSQIAGMFGVPPHLLGDVDRTSSWGTGVAEQGRAFVSYTLLPYLRRIEAVFSRMLPGNQVVRFDVDELTQPDMAARYAAYAIGLSNNFLNPDEVRLDEGMPPIPNGEGQVFRHPANIVGPDESAPAGPVTPVAPAAAPAAPPTDGAPQ